jgi:hypothetical protein
MLLEDFCFALKTLTGQDGKQLMWDIEKFDLHVPSWYRDAKGLWCFDKLVTFTAPAYGIERCSLLRICKYIKLPEHQLVALLFKFSMLSVVLGEVYSIASGVKVEKKIQYRQLFRGRRHNEGWKQYTESRHGFVVCRRQADGDFRRKAVTAK